MSDVTEVLNAIRAGDAQASAELLPLVYDRLRKLAAQQLSAEKPGQTLQATALVHEAYLRLVKDDPNQKQWDSKSHFFGSAALAMRRILVENARRKLRLKHGANHQRVAMDAAEIACAIPDSDLLALDEALSDLAEEEPLKAQLVELRFFAGMTVEEAAQVLDTAPITAKRHWRIARAWLHQKISNGND